MKITALGEFGLIADLARLARRADPALLLGIGDDAAVWTTSAGAEMATSDILVEGIHFRLDRSSWYEVGWKAVAVNLSDIAAMGGKAERLLVNIALPPDTAISDVEALYQGMLAIADQFGTVIAGGDTVRSPGPVVVSIMALGAARVVGGQVQLLRRDAARIGDVVGVTGTLGAAGAGLAMLLSGLPLPPEIALPLRAAQVTPTPRMPEAQVLLANGVAAAMDVSDGLAADLAKVCHSSGVAAIVDEGKLPIPAAVRQAFPDRALALALSAGEDYELLFTAPATVFRQAQSELAREGLAPATAIGEIVAGVPGTVWLRASGQLREVSGGYDAFKE